MAATNIETWQSATVIEVIPVAEAIARIVLEPSLPIKAEPGSHIDLMVQINGESVKRSYSVVEAA
ncbi:MAG: oxidoreductase, partial [Paeniglutamicibacter terrestris]